MVMTLRVVALRLIALLPLVAAPDPSGGWLSYAVFEADSADDIITSLSATMSVPDAPLSHGAEPAFWFGVQTHAGDGALVQPIQAKWLGRHWDMFHETFDWTTHRDSASDHFAVPPGDSVWAEVKYKKADNSYDMFMTSAKTGQSVTFNYPLHRRQTATESTAYFVLEHQPRECSQLPPNGFVVWSNISVEVNYEKVASPVFTAKQEAPACGSKVHIVGENITLTWDASAQEAEADGAAAMVEATAGGGGDATMVRVPGGHVVPRPCIARLPNRATFDETTAAPLAGCDTERVAAAAPEIQIYAADTHLKSAAPLTSFTADWVVPPYPKSRGFQVVYLWPGFKASSPEMGYPVLQPVLQFGERGPRWALQSWFVDAHDHRYPVVTAPPIDVSPGDRITSFMRLSADNTTWTVSGTNTKTGDDSTLHIKYARAGDTDYDYAMLVNENVNVNTRCARMPAVMGVTFTNVTVNGMAHPGWTTRANCKGDPRCDCDNAASVDEQTGDVTLSWDYTK